MRENGTTLMIWRLALALGKTPDEIREEDSLLITEGLAFDRVMGLPNDWRMYSEFMSWFTTIHTGKHHKPKEFTVTKPQPLKTTPESIRRMFAGMPNVKVELLNTK